MPPAVVAVAAVVATVAIDVFVTSVVLAAVLTIAVNVAATLLTRKPKGRTTASQGQEVKLKLDPAMPRQIPLGAAGTGGSVVWAFTYGTKNEFLVRIIALSDLPIPTGSVQVYEGKKQLTFASSIYTGFADCSNSYKTKSGTPRMKMRVYTGSPTPVADASLISWSGGQWTSAHKGTNMAYAIVHYGFDEDGNAFPNGEPSLTFVVGGVPCYDDRQDGSKPGRTGTQRLTDPSTWVTTKNAGVITAQMLRGFYSKGVLLFGAQAEARDLDDAMLLSAYNTCSEVVGASTGNQARYEIGIMVNTHEALANYLVEFQAAMDGRIIDRGGAITILPGATRTPVFNLTDDDINWATEKSWQPRATLTELYNYVTGSFIDAATIYQEKAYPPLRNTTWETQDGGERLTMNVAFSAVTDWARVQRITKRIHEASRFQGTIAFVLPLWGLEMEQGDWFTFTSVRWNFTTKYFECMSCDLTTEGMVVVTGRETSPTINGWNHSVDEKPRDDTFWNPPAVILEVPTLAAAPLYAAATTQSAEAFGVSLTIGGIGFGTKASTVELELAYTADLAHPRTLGIYQARDQIAEAWGLLPATDYSVRARTAEGQWTSDWSSWVDFATDASTQNIDIDVPPQLNYSADYLGVPDPAQFPDHYTPSVKQGLVDIHLSDDTQYSAVFDGCTGGINTTNGDPNKGQVTITGLTDPNGFIDVIVTYLGLQQPTKRTLVSRVDAAPPPPTGGSGAKSALINTFVAPTSTVTYTVVGGPVTVNRASGEKLYGTGVLSYNADDTCAMHTKWQYSPAGAGTWTDFGSPKLGTNAWPAVGGSEPAPKKTGNVDTSQNVTPGGTGDYDVRLVGVKTNSGATLSSIRTSVLVEAKP